MEIKFHTRRTTQIVDRIATLALPCSKISIAVAYLSRDGLDKIEPIFGSEIDVRILCGIHGSISDLPVLRKITARIDGRVRGHVFIGENLFHPKLYVFQTQQVATILVGSPNLTLGGLTSNEEICVELGGQLSDPVVCAVIAYFDNLWESQSIAVDRYLAQHPDYMPRQATHESLSNLQYQIVRRESDSIRAQTWTFSFDKNVGLSFFQYGDVTIPKEHYTLLDELNYLGTKKSKRVKIILPDGLEVDGNIRRNKAGYGWYYQLRVSGPGPKHYFTEQLQGASKVRFEVNLSDDTVHVWYK